ncbi:MAG: alpha/beta fold hydrolase [Sphingobacteriales bacterium]|nr:MAG: alpha/beta fold hydrolase [Sphingobacteriales bacterium]
MQTIVLLHGAIGAKDQLQPLADMLKDTFDVHTLSFSGHGENDFAEYDYSIPAFAHELLQYLDAQKLEKVSVFGYSMGGYVALYLAKQYPERVNKIVTLATKFYWDEATAQKEMQMLDADKIEAKLPAFAAVLEKRHTPKPWKEVLHRTKDMLKALGDKNTLQPEDYATIQIPTLVMLGDKDKMVGLDETVAVYRQLPNAQMAMLPATQHPIEQANLPVLAYFIQYFLG